MFKILVRTFSFKCLKVGDEAVLVKKISAQDVQKFAELSGDSNPVHSETQGQRALVHGAYLNSLVSCVMGTKLPGPGTLVAKQTLNFPHKCYVDDTVTVTVRVVEARKIVKVAFVCDVQAENKTVMFGDAQLVLDKR